MSKIEDMKRYVDYIEKLKHWTQRDMPLVINHAVTRWGNKPVNTHVQKVIQGHYKNKLNRALEMNLDEWLESDLYE